MKAKSKKMTALTAGALALALVGGVKWAEATNSGASQDNSYQAPANYNRASAIVGMHVLNQNDEHLGCISDVVFDPNSERVSYAVMVVSPKVEIATSPKGAALLKDQNQKFVAVPLSALKASADGDYLVLNADKSKVEEAMGFDRNNWPSVGNPSWGAQPFWQNSSDTPSGAVSPNNIAAGTPNPNSNPNQIAPSKPAPDQQENSVPANPMGPQPQ